MANGQYTAKTADLDISFAGEIREERESFVSPYGFCAVDYDKDQRAVRVGCRAYNPQVFYAIYYATGERGCCSYNFDDYAAQGLCRSIFPGSAMYNGCPGGAECRCYKG